jgi:glycerol-3-phosphate acyltransferase PlsY
MDWMLYLIAGFGCGSIPFGMLIARAKGVDIRAHGSGNIGATNVWRVLGRRPGMLCFTLDVLKGLIPSLVAGLLLGTIGKGAGGTVGTGIGAGTGAGIGAGAGNGNGEVAAVWLHLGVGVAAILGHMFTPWAGFKGGKGVATAFGALLGVWPVMTIAVGLALIVWVVVFKVGRMVGIASVLAAVVVPLGVVGVGLIGRASGIESLEMQTPHLVVGGVLATLVVWKHRGNIKRTLAGTEPRFEKGKRHEARGNGQ